MAEFTFITSSDFDINNESLFTVNEEQSSSENMIHDMSFEKINNIFNYESFPFEEDTIDISKRFLIPDKKNSANKKSNLFIVTENTNDKTQLTKKKRGKPSISNTDNAKIHDKFSLDNLLVKIKNHSLSLIAPFLNDILKVLFIEEEFYQLSHKFKKNIKNNFFVM